MILLPADPLRRQVFDLYGEEGLKKGVTSPTGYIEPYVYHEKCDETYSSVMGSYSPYADLIDAVTHPPPLLATCGNRCAKVKDPPIQRLLNLNLTEVFFGGTKKLKVQRLELIDDMQCKTELREKLLVINFPPGVLPGTRYVFPEEGDQGPTRIPADIVFVVVDRPHEVFRREKANLHMRCQVSLKDALVGFGITVLMLDGRKFNVPITTTPISPGYVHNLVGEGLPLMDRPSERGNLYIAFESAVNTDFIYGK
jgi:DnaJ homolog subfamily B member 13